MFNVDLDDFDVDHFIRCETIEDYEAPHKQSIMTSESYATADGHRSGYRHYVDVWSCEVI